MILSVYCISGASTVFSTFCIIGACICDTMDTSTVLSMYTTCGTSTVFCIVCTMGFTYGTSKYLG